MTVGPSHPIMSNTDRIDSIENELICIQHTLGWMPEKLADAYREIKDLSERVAALETKLCVYELEAGAAN